jgi:signal peptidase I
VASPELPDDRRGQPRRQGPADPADQRAGAGPVAGERPQGQVPGFGPNGAPFPGPAAYPSSAPQRLGVPPVNGQNGRNGSGAHPGYGTSVNGEAPTGPQPVTGGPQAGHGAPPMVGGPPPSNGIGRNGSPANGTAPGRAPGSPADHTAPITGGPAADRPGRPRGVHPVGPPIPPRAAPQRYGRPAVDDRPTDVVAPVESPAERSVDPQLRVDPTATGPDGIPGRHRRRAGASPEGVSAASYVQRSGPGGKKPKPGRRRRSTFWKELPILVGVALVLTIVIQAFVAKVYVIPSGSMETTLHGCTGCTNDRVLVDKITYRFSDPAPGDVVVFRGPDSWVNTEFTVDEPTSTFGEVVQQFLSLVGLAPPDEKDFVKRVIAVGGQTVACCDSRNRVMVDGQPLDEPYIYYLPAAGPARQIPFGPITVPQGELWVMGDSRNNSSDSRIDGHGPIPVENVIGKARMKVLPISRFGFIDDTNPQTRNAALAAAANGAPAALAVFGVLPLVLVRRRLLSREEDFLPGLERR